MSILHKVTFILLVVGGLNWGLVGLFDFNLVMMLFGAWPMLEKLVYILVGASAIVEVVLHPKTCALCMNMMKK